MNAFVSIVLAIITAGLLYIDDWQPAILCGIASLGLMAGAIAGRKRKSKIP